MEICLSAEGGCFASLAAVLLQPPSSSRISGACMAELDLSTAISTMGAGLHLLQRDLILESLRVELEQKQSARANLL